MLPISSNVEIRKWKLTYKSEKTEKSLGGASIVLTKGNSVISSSTSNSDGDFTVMVPPNGIFMLTVSYPGCNTKKFEIITTGVPEALQKDNFKPSFSIGGFVMAKPFPGIDYSGLQQALVKVVYDPRLKNFNDDEDYTNNVGLSIVSKINDAETILINKFCGLNKQGDDALAIPDCPLARRLYKEAIATIPGEEYPVIQLAKVPDCEKIEEEKKKAEEAAKKAEDEKKAAELASKKAAEEKAIADKANKDKAEEEKKKAAEEKIIVEKANKEKAAAEKAEANKLAKEKAAADKEAKTKALTEKEAADKEAKANAAKNKPVPENTVAKKPVPEKKKTPEKKPTEKEQENYSNKMPGDEGKVNKHEYKTKQKDDEPVIGHGNSKYRKPQILAPNKYKDALAKAEGFLKMKRWAEAKLAYEEVLKIKPNDVYATGKLVEVNKFLAK